MRPATWILAPFAVFLLSGPALADELQVPASGSAGANHPARGMTMEKVEATFGAPANRVPAVGEPPITRWEYPGFVVYFERNLVLHSVIIG